MVQFSQCLMLCLTQSQRWLLSSGLLGPILGLPASVFLNQLSPLQTLGEAPSPCRTFSCQQLFFPCMELIAGIFPKRKPGESHFSLNVERKQRSGLRAWMAQIPSASLLQNGLHSHQSLLVTGMACLSLWQKTLPRGSSRPRAVYPGTFKVDWSEVEVRDMKMGPSANPKGGHSL